MNKRELKKFNYLSSYLSLILFIRKLKVNKSFIFKISSSAETNRSSINNYIYNKFKINEHCEIYIISIINKIIYKKASKDKYFNK